MIVALATLVSCSNDEGTDPGIEDLDDATSEAIVDFVNDDIDNIVIENMNEIRGVGGDANLGQNFNPFRGSGGCAEVSHDEVEQVITVDFGDGCVNDNGVERSGKIIISYTDRRHVPGAVITTTFEDFFVNGHQISGTRTLTNVSDQYDAYRAFNIVVSGGQIAFSDGSTRTFESNRTRIWSVEATSQEVTLTVTGSASGTRRNGVSFSKNIVEPVVFKFSCRQVGVRVAVQGIRSISTDEGTTTIDYGDGTCDNLVTVTHPDGTVEEIAVRNRQRDRG